MDGTRPICTVDRPLDAIWETNCFGSRLVEAGGGLFDGVFIRSCGSAGGLFCARRLSNVWSVGVPVEDAEAGGDWTRGLFNLPGLEKFSGGGLSGDFCFSAETLKVGSVRTLEIPRGGGNSEDVTGVMGDISS